MKDISNEDWRTAIDSMRPFKFTKEMIEFIQYAKESDNPLSFTQLTPLFNKRFGTDFKSKLLSSRYYDYKRREEI